MGFLARLVSDNSGNLEKMELGAPSCPATPKEKKLCTGSEFVFVARGYLRIRFDLPSSTNIRDISGFPKLGTHNLY